MIRGTLIGMYHQGSYDSLYILEPLDRSVVRLAWLEIFACFFKSDYIQKFDTDSKSQEPHHTAGLDGKEYGIYCIIELNNIILQHRHDLSHI
jgi:hypothetical protein